MLEKIHPLFKLIMFACFSFLSMIIFTFLGFLITGAIYDMNIQEMMELSGLISTNPDALLPEDVNILKMNQFFQASGLFLVPAILAGYFFSKSFKSFLYFRRTPGGISIGMTILIIVMMYPFIMFLKEINTYLLDLVLSENNSLKAMGKNMEMVTEKMLGTDSFSGIITNIIVIAMLPAVAEELFFRGVVQRLLVDWIKNHHIAIIITAILFSTFHMEFYSYLPRVAIGIVFGYMVVWSKSIWLPVIAHFINNFAAVMLYYFFGVPEMKEMESYGFNVFNLLMVLFSVLFLGFALFYLYRIEKKKSSGPERTNNPETN